MKSDLKSNHFSLPPFYYLAIGLGFLLAYFIMLRDLGFFVPRDFVYFEGPGNLVPFGPELSKSYIRHFSPPFLASLFWKNFLLLPGAVLLSLFIVKRYRPGSLERLFSRICHIRHSIVLSLVCLMALIAILVLIRFVFQDTYVTDDENAYIFQARILERGKVLAPAPPVEKSFSNFFIITKGAYTGKYTLVHPAILAFSHVITKSFHTLPVLLSLATILLFYFTGSELYNRQIGLLASILLAVSPLFLFNSATFLSHPGTLFFLSLFMYGFIVGKRRGSWFYGLLSGMAVGAAFNIRPLTAIGFGLPFALYLAWRMTRSPSKSAGFFLSCFAGFLVLVLFTLWYNRLVSGNPLVFPFNVHDPNERIGFGKMLHGLHYTHTPLKGLQNLLVSLGRYNLWLFGIPCSFLFLWPLLAKGRWWRGDYWCFAVIASFFLAYIFYYSPGVPETGPIYYFELLLPLCLLSARGLVNLHKIFQSNETAPWLKMFVPVFFSVSILLGIATFHQEKALHMIAMTDRLKEPYDLVEERAWKPALVFIRSLPRVGWVFGYRNTDPWLEAPILYCKSLGEEKNREVMLNFPGREYYILSYNPSLGRSELQELPETEEMELKSIP